MSPTNLSTQSPFTCGTSRCHYPSEYCDAYESACQDCSKLCSISEKFQECIQLCAPFVKEVLFATDVRFFKIGPFQIDQFKLKKLNFFEDKNS